jgi:hypothetical protein
MTKHQTREVQNVRTYVRMGMDDTAARALSALIRAALRKNDREELMKLAGPQGLGLVNHPEFII